MKKEYKNGIRDIPKMKDIIGKIFPTIKNEIKTWSLKIE